MTRAVVFAYSEVGVRCVRELLAQEIKIPLLFTHADDPGEAHWFGSVAELGRAHGLKVETPDDPNSVEWIAEGRRARPDFLFSFYYRHMLNAEWLALPKRGALNMHGSLLPKYRGRAPVHWAIIHGEPATGASLHYMLEKPDAGALVDQQSVPILENDTALAVSIKVAEAAQQVLARSAAEIDRGQRGGACARPRQGVLFRAPRPGGRPHRLARGRSRHPRSGTRRGAAVPGCLYRRERLETRGAGNPGRRAAGSLPGACAVPVRGGRLVVRRLRRRQASRDSEPGDRAEAGRSRSAAAGLVGSAARARLTHRAEQIRSLS